jgi:hypothetical protein
VGGGGCRQDCRRGARWGAGRGAATVFGKKWVGLVGLGHKACGAAALLARRRRGAAGCAIAAWLGGSRRRAVPRPGRIIPPHAAPLVPAPLALVGRCGEVGWLGGRMRGLRRAGPASCCRGWALMLRGVGVRVAGCGGGSSHRRAHDGQGPAQQQRGSTQAVRTERDILGQGFLDPPSPPPCPFPCSSSPPPPLLLPPAPPTLPLPFLRTARRGRSRAPRRAPYPLFGAELLATGRLRPGACAPCMRRRRRRRGRGEGRVRSWQHPRALAAGHNRRC